MRIKFLLQCVSKPTVIPINYNHQFSSAINRLLGIGSPEFVKFLQVNGYKIDNRNFNLFTFAIKLKKYEILNNFRFTGNHFLLLSPFVELLISSPMIETFFKNSLESLVENKKIIITHKEYVTRFIIKQVELVPNPEFTEEMNFRLLSPIVLSKMVLKNGKQLPYYFRINDNGIEESLKNNLIRKYKLIYNRDISIDDFHFVFDNEYIEKKNGVVSKLITLAEGTNKESKIKGILCDFKIRTNPELIKVGYESGFGEQNSMGFGFVECNTKV